MAEQFVYGLHAVTALLKNRHRTTYQLFVNQERTDSRVQHLLELATNRHIPIELLTIQKMNQRFTKTSHQSVVARTSSLPDYCESDLFDLLAANDKPANILILDGITDPHNLGACLRTADAAGVDFIIVPKDKSASITPVVSKIASGAAESIPLVRVTNLARAIDSVKQAGAWVYGAAATANQVIYQLNLTTPVALVIGAEGHGLRRLTQERCDGLFSLPMFGSIESLNASVATGIVLYEIVRQRYTGVAFS
jgi:23S rRNA (guanosine2251-2'-O)-methyltransferase